MIVNETNDGTTSVLDKTWQEINDAFPNVYVAMSGPNSSKVSVMYVAIGRKYIVNIMEIGNSYRDYIADSADEYPTYESGGNPK